MGEHAVYLYAIGDSSLVGTEAVAAVRGLDGEPLRLIEEGTLAAIVGSVDAAEFSEESLRANLEDLRWLEGTARAHDAVVARVARVHPIAPVRLATVYTDDENVRVLLRENATAFSAALDRVRGRAEWGVKAFAVSHSPAPREAPAAGGPGTSYLMRRRAERERASAARSDSAEAAEKVHQSLAGLAVASRRYRPQDPRLTGHANEMVLNAAYLVEETRTADFRQKVEHLDGGSLELSVTGPWAPYSFATLEEP